MRCLTNLILTKKHNTILSFSYSKTDFIYWVKKMIQVSAVGYQDSDTKRHRHKHKQSEIKRQKLLKEVVNRFQRVTSNRNNLRIISLSAICECFVGATAAHVCTSPLINDETRELILRKLWELWWEPVHIQIFYSVALCAM